MTGKNIPTAIGFAVITLSQLVLGMFLIIFAARDGGKANPFVSKETFPP